jgi:hypothetical protein
LQRLFVFWSRKEGANYQISVKSFSNLDSYDIIQLYIVTELTDGRVSDRLFSVPYTPKENIKNPGKFIVFSAWYAAKALEMDVK